MKINLISGLTKAKFFGLYPPMMQDFSDHIKKLSDDADITARARFNAARRCEYLNSLSNWTISLISLLLIALPILQNLDVPPFSETGSKLNAILIFLAVFILVFSLLSNIEGYTLKAYKYHKVGMKLNDFKRSVEAHALADVTPEKYNSLLRRYKLILGESENHDDVDYKMYLWQEELKERRKHLRNHSAPLPEEKILWCINKAWWEAKYPFFGQALRYYLALATSLGLIIWAVII
ncbi:SLATT domain-containing protein [Deinococcus sp.]|uniref:SLATT domain-containing protein n=1 Tax=Deinococcus sp. TaxID=47478 RepID=UPI003B5C25A4